MLSYNSCHGLVNNVINMRLISNICTLTCQTLDNGLNIIQLETAVGAGIKSFEGAVGMLNLYM